MREKNKTRFRRPFLLVEALVAITLLFMGGFLFFEIESAIIKKARMSTKKVQAEISYQLAVSQLVEDLHKKKFSDEINREFITDHLELTADKNWKVKYQFEKLKPIEPVDPAYIVNVKIVSLMHNEWGEFLQEINPRGVVFEFCVLKK